MTSYTITVAPSDGSGNTTTITVDTGSGEALITDVRLHATKGLSAARMPFVDIALLMQAITAEPALSSPDVSPVLADKPTRKVLTAARPAAAAPATAPDATVSDTAPATDVPAPAQAADTAAQPTTPPTARVRRPRAAKETTAPKPAAKKTAAAAPKPAKETAAAAKPAKESTAAAKPAKETAAAPKPAAKETAAAKPAAKEESRRRPEAGREATRSPTCGCRQLRRPRSCPRPRSRPETQGTSSASRDPGHRQGACLPPYARRLLRRRDPAQQRIGHRRALRGAEPHSPGLAAPSPHQHRQLIRPTAASLTAGIGS
jgi:hypothetical protein